MKAQAGEVSLKVANDELLRLVERARSGDRAAVEALVEAVAPCVSALARGCCRGRQDAEDVRQESLMELCRSIGRLAQPGAFLPWLRRLVRNNAADLSRRRSSRREVALEPDREALRPTAAPRLEAAERRRAVLDAVGRLDGLDREMLALRHEAGMSLEAIAAVTGHSVRAVESRMFRARRDLRRLLGGEAPT